MKKVLIGVIFALILAGSALSDQADPEFGYSALSNLDQLWLFSGKVRTAMFSSADPSGGNLDMKNFHGKFRGENILAQIDGPGCVYRIWSALPSGRIKVYLDGSKKAEINCDFREYLEGKCEGLPGDFSVGRTANYLPIPFAKSIIITAPGFIFPAYYQVSYQTYDSSVPVASFRKSEARSDPGLKPASELWKDFALPDKDASALKKVSEQAGLESGKETAALALTGPGIIRKLSFKDAFNPKNPLQDLRLKIFWDGNSEPAVDAPLSAFFINQPDLKNKWPDGSLKNIFISAGSDGYQCYFPMPFAKSAAISILNQGRPISLKIDAWYEKRDSLPANAMRFRSRYRSQEYPAGATRENTIPINTPINPETNYVVLDQKGQGNYLGCAIFVNSVGTLWWGEGDEMTYIDGASKPQIQGTGTEDEFNWSWGFNPNMNPVSGTLPAPPECKETIIAQIFPKLINPKCQKTQGDNIAYRFRPSDYVPFNRSIKVSYEILGAAWPSPNETTKPGQPKADDSKNKHRENLPILGNLSQFRGDDYASVAYWYQLP